MEREKGQQDYATNRFRREDSCLAYGHSMLVANVIKKHGRATPLAWKSVEKSTMKEHRNE